jgi:branched-subunit amino acid ABC-type transport system permease component
VTDHLQYLLLGLGGGAVIAALALGLLLTYRASGVVNFAHAATGMWLAYTYLALRRDGDLLLPIIGLPDEVTLLPEGYRFSWATALAITMVLAAVYGLVIHTLVFRPLRHAPALAKVVASLGLFLYLLAIADLRTGDQGAALTRTESLLPDGVVEVAGLDVPQDRIWLTVLVLAVTAGLAALYHLSRFGLATRAAAENEKGAILLGHSPDRLAAANWVLATMLAGAAVILIAPIAGLNPSATSLLIVPALAAALLGGFRSFVVTAAAGLAIGMVQSELLNLRTEWGWLPDIGFQQGLPFLLIVATLVWRGESLPTRSTLRTGHFPRSPSPGHATWWAVGLTAVAVAALLTLGSEWRQAIIVTSIFALIALSIVVLTGYVGQISLMPMALAGISAFAMIKLSTSADLPFPLAPLLAAGLAVAVGLVAGVPAVRVRGMNLAIATLAAAVAIEELVLKWGWFTGGLEGATVPTPELFGVDLGISATGTDFPRPAFGILCVAVLAAAAVGVANLRRGSTGLRWLAVRANERAAAAAGVDVTRTKLGAFATSSFLAGLGGSLLAYQYDTLSVNSFLVFQSLSLLAVTYLGGIAALGGALVAGVMTDGGLLSAALGRRGGETQFAVNGLLLIVVAIVYPDGVTGALYRVMATLRRRWSPGGTDGRRDVPGPDTPEDPADTVPEPTHR